MNFARESIFVAAVRKFCTAFSAVLGVLIALVLVIIGLAFFAAPTMLPDHSTLVVAPDAKAQRALLPPSDPVLLRIDIKGVIGSGDLISSKLDNMLYDSREGVLSNNRVKGILLYMDTPGGTASDSDTIYRALMDYKKRHNVPIYAYVDGLCASGGMYIACAADKIYASESSIIGSVGVILGPNFNFSGLMQQHGVQALTLTEGKDKDTLNPFRPWTPNEGADLKTITAALYQRFVDDVVAARPLLSKEKLINIYGAQVFIAQEAQEFGYIDNAKADYFLAVKDLAAAAQIAEATPYQVLTIEPPRALLSEFAHTKLSLLQGKVTHTFQFGPYLNSECSGKFLYLYQPAPN
jgi:signal peptide peptidase SppA